MPTLKKENNTPLVVALLFHAIFFWAVLTGNWEFASQEWVQIVNKILANSLVAAALGVIAFLLQGLLHSDLKARIVFGRLRGNPYPAAQAFSIWLNRDPRINPKVIKERHHPLPENPNEQNTLWYSFLKKHESSSTVEDAHRRFLLARDLATNFLLFGFPASIIVWWGKSPIWSKALFDGATILVIVLTIVVARNHGFRLVTSVLAAESAK